MRDEIRKKLIDILHAAEEIQNFTCDFDFKSYQESLVTQCTVERDFEIALNFLQSQCRGSYC